MPSLHRPFFLPALLTLLSACGDPATRDFDKDGLIGSEDCNDSNATVGGPLGWYTDADADGYGDDDSVVFACSAPDEMIAASGDCNDDNAAIHPDATEVCDEVDNDCDGSIDQDASDAVDWYADADSDTYGDPNVVIAACAAPEGYGSDATDCDDTDATIYPGAPETYYDGVDANCDPTDENDADGDGDDSSEHGGTDCDDQNPVIYGGAPEICDGFDNDCDPQTLEFGLIGRQGQSYTTIADALAGAAAMDTVNVCGGTYTETLTIDVDLVLKGIDGASDTTISAAGAGGAPIVVNADDVTIEGFTITGGMGTPREGCALAAGSQVSRPLASCPFRTAKFATT